MDEAFGRLRESLCSRVVLYVPVSSDSFVFREMDEAFGRLRESLCSRVVLYVPVSSDSFVLYTDASGGGVGACLHVVCEEDEFPVAFFSRQLRGVERNYSVTELETLAIVAAVLRFDFYFRQLNRRLTRLALKLQDRELEI